MATNKIGENAMKLYFMKNLHIQDNYCSINPRNVNQEISDSSIAVKVRDILNRIDEVDKVRMIKFSRIKQDVNDIDKGRKGFMLNKVKHRRVFEKHNSTKVEKDSILTGTFQQILIFKEHDTLHHYV